MDRPAWARFHTRLVLSLGTAWVLWPGDHAGQTFPVEIRAAAIAAFFAVAQVLGAVGPILLGALIGTGHDPFRLFAGYVIGGGIMIIGGVVELLLSVAAKGKGTGTGRLPADRGHGDPGPRERQCPSTVLAERQAAAPHPPA